MVFVTSAAIPQLVKLHPDKPTGSSTEKLETSFNMLDLPNVTAHITVPVGNRLFTLVLSRLAESYCLLLKARSTG